MRLSNSAIQILSKCPRRYELEQIKPPETVSQQLYLGGTFHLVQNTFFRCRMAGYEMTIQDCLDAFKTYWDSFQAAEGRSVNWGRERPDNIEEMGLRMVESYYPYAKQLTPVLVENKVERVTEHCTVSGIIDLLTYPTSIVDYKTSAWFPVKTELDRDLQPTVYLFLMNSIVPFYYHYIMKFKSPLVRIFPTKRDDYELYFFEHQILPKTVEMIKAGVFPPFGRINGQCRFCTQGGDCG